MALPGLFCLPFFIAVHSGERCGPWASGSICDTYEVIAVLKLVSKIPSLSNISISENFSQDDETLMKAKINFTATVVISHPNIVKFVGAVVDDTTSKNMLLITSINVVDVTLNQNIVHDTLGN